MSRVRTPGGPPNKPALLCGFFLLLSLDWFAT
nr:MAG TPA: hypothetical protein [Caudoviricetes sp.]